MQIHVVLFEPEIPQNTGNIARTCAATGAELHLVGPLGFSVDEKHVKRAGLDYWPAVKIHQYDSIDSFFSKHGDENLFFFTTKATRCYSDVSYIDGRAYHGDAQDGGADDIWLVFGKESAGIPEDILQPRQQRCVRIPMIGDTRSLNLSNSVAIAVYEVLRQSSFPGMTTKGHLHHLKWGRA
ncbi:MAG: tRNA (cytidine(34)-2'-O)-methyltransferase [Sphaerochaetaceae bacterium]